MRIIYKMFVIFAMFATQQVFADDAVQNEPAPDKACIVIAKACSSAGFVSRRSETKGIWHNCMEPTLLGQTVSGVKVDPSVVKTCRVHKIKELQMQLEKFKQVS